MALDAPSAQRAAAEEGIRLTAIHNRLTFVALQDP